MYLEDGCKTVLTKEPSSGDRRHETPPKNSSVRASDEDLPDDASSMAHINGPEDDSSSVNADRGISGDTIAEPVKRDAESDGLDASEPPAKRPRPRPRKRISPTSSSTGDADTASPQTTTRDHVDEMYGNAE